ncbi:hypothetical protein ACE1CD_13590 [Aerosakkonema sp. BLCC-F183]|uniref:hypothetical protein n=1 Tax=Aerosakkonema sp. BLCC-F183 TaxID=3342834 RepID=UPI0035B91B8C
MLKTVAKSGYNAETAFGHLKGMRGLGDLGPVGAGLAPDVTDVTDVADVVKSHGIITFI